MKISPMILLALGAVSACGGSPPSSEAPSPEMRPRIVQPGAPGEAGREYEGRSLADIEGVTHTPADVRFMQGMIPHHAQALDMTALVPSRTDDEAFQRMALRMEISQKDEIDMMERWLRARGEAVPEDHAHHAMASGGMAMMPGMLSPAQMDQLAGAQGVEFKRLFLEFMIQHHQGALVMVRDLFSTSGAGQESAIFQFASHVDADQGIEIARMRQMLQLLDEGSLDESQ